MKNNKTHTSYFYVFTILLFAVVLYFMTPVFAQMQTTSNEIKETTTNIDLVLKDAPLRMALELLSSKAGLRLDVHSGADVGQKVSVNLKDLPVNLAIESVLRGKKLDSFVDNNVLHVFQPHSQSTKNNVVVPQIEKQTKKVSSKVISFQNRKVEDIIKVLETVAEDIKVISDIQTNSCIVTGTKADIARVAKMAKQLDFMQVNRKTEETFEFISKVFSLDYITDTEDLESNLNFILYGTKSEMTEQAVDNKTIAVVPVRKEYYLFDQVRRVLMITASRDKMDVIEKYFNKINVPLAQVVIEAHIVAIDAGFEKKLGIQWNMVGGYQGPSRPTANPLGIPAQTTGGTAVDAAQDFVFGKWNLTSLTALLESIQSKNKGKILSQPKLMTLSGHEAEIDISTRYPYKQSTTVSQTGTTENITFVPVGIRLLVNPRVNEQTNSITMVVEPSVSDLVGFRNDIPITTSRKAKTMVEVKHGETIIIGGLLRNEELRERNGVPILREIPVIGEFFRWSRKTNNKTNLVIMITPRIVRLNKMNVNNFPEVVSGKAPVIGSPKEETKPISGLSARMEKLKEKIRSFRNQKLSDKE